MSSGTGPIWRFDRFMLNTATWELTLDGRPVGIEPQSLRLLEYLIRNRDRVVTRDNLIEALWQGRAISDWAISGAIKALRAALQDTGPQKRFVRTVHSKGFRFVAEIKTDTPDLQDNTQTPKPTILVRKFRAPEQAEDVTYLADGITEDLITDLSRNPALGVLSFNATLALGGHPPAGNTGVSCIVDGSLRQVGENIRINVAILEADGGKQIWAERFDLAKDSLVAGQDRISARVSDILTPGTGHGVARAIATRSSQAYDRYLKGRYDYFSYNPTGFSAALTHFEAATLLDPGFAGAYAQQAYCRTTLFVFGIAGCDKTLDPAEAIARKAVALDAYSALAHARLGWVLGYRGRPQETIKAFETAVSRDPENAEVYFAFGETMNRLAQPAQARPLIDIAFAKDAYFPPSWEFARGHTQLLLRSHERAITHFRAVLSRVERFIPARVQLVRAYVESGNTQAAKAEVAKLKSLAPKYGLSNAERMFPYPEPSERKGLRNALINAGMN